MAKDFAVESIIMIRKKAEQALEKAKEALKYAKEQESNMKRISKLAEIQAKKMQASKKVGTTTKKSVSSISSKPSPKKGLERFAGQVQPPKKPAWYLEAEKKDKELAHYNSGKIRAGESNKDYLDRLTGKGKYRKAYLQNRKDEFQGKHLWKTAKWY